jgi:hypothetical protein
MVRAPETATIDRDNALLLLRELTKASAIVATILLGAFSLIAAMTIPGTSSPGSSASNPAATNSNQVPADNGELQPPSEGQVQAGAGAPSVAVTGGSGH